MKPKPLSASFLELKEALAAPFQHMVNHAVTAGWTRMEVLAAIADLADNAMRAEFADSETNRAIRESRAETKQ